MKIAVVIASTMRPATLAATLSSLSAQSRPADEIVVSVVNETDLPNPLPAWAKAIFSERGASRQRNRGTESLSKDTDIVVFLDDDMILHRDYLRGIERAFADEPDAALIMGHLLANGGVSVSQATSLLTRRSVSNDYFTVKRNFGGVYGCNMCARYSVALAEPLDERLPLYSYMEDMDFGTRVRRHGHIGYYYGSLAVHLRAKEGRVCHRALGFSEVMNPAYLAAKGTIPLSHALAHFILRKPIANLARTIIGPKRRSRMERFVGNCTAIGKLLSGKTRPEYAEFIESHAAISRRLRH